MYVITECKCLHSCATANNNPLLFAWADILPFRNCNTRNNRLAVVVDEFCSFHIHKSTYRHLWAWFPFFCVHSWGR